MPEHLYDCTLKSPEPVGIGQPLRKTTYFLIGVLIMYEINIDIGKISIQRSFEDFNNTLTLKDDDMILVALRYFMFDFYVLSSYNLKKLNDKFRSDIEDVNNIISYLNNFNNSIYKMMFFDEGLIHTKNPKEVVEIFNRKWDQPEWFAGMILEGLVNSFKRSSVILHGLLSLLSKHEEIIILEEYRSIHMISDLFIRVCKNSGDHIANINF